jgi:uncharacterized protein with GYD domain
MRFVLIGHHSPEWIGRAKERGEQAHAMCKALNIAVETTYYTQGEFDYVTTIDAPDAEAASAFAFAYMRKGFGRVQVMRAFSADEVNKFMLATGQ